MGTLKVAVSIKIYGNQVGNGQPVGDESAVNRWRGAEESSEAWQLGGPRDA